MEIEKLAFWAGLAASVAIIATLGVEAWKKFTEKAPDAPASDAYRVPLPGRAPAALRVR